MTKQQTIELLQQQLPGFYSVEQVIKMISDIEDKTSPLNSTTIEGLCKVIKDHIQDNLDGVDSDDIVDKSSAEFVIEYGNTIELNSIDIDSSNIAEAATDGLFDTIEEFFNKQGDE